jgi:hypothetical protein
VLHTVKATRERKQTLWYGMQALQQLPQQTAAMVQFDANYAWLQDCLSYCDDPGAAEDFSQRMDKLIGELPQQQLAPQQQQQQQQQQLPAVPAVTLPIWLLAEMDVPVEGAAGAGGVT